MILKIQPRSKSSTGLAYIKLGQGPSLVLIHGVGLRLEAWLRQLDVLSTFFTLYAIDIPGHGESDIMPHCHSIDAYADAVADWIKAEVQMPVVIIGHSMGAMIALSFATRYHSYCTGIIALNSIFRRSTAAKKAVLARLDALTEYNLASSVKRWFDFPLKAADKENAKLCTQWLQQVSFQGYRQAYEVFCANDGPARQDLCELNVPALFITGRSDRNSTPVMSECMAGLCPQGTSAIIEQAKHMAPMTHSEVLNHLLIQFALDCTKLTKRSRL